MFIIDGVAAQATVDSGAMREIASHLARSASERPFLRTAASGMCVAAGVEPGTEMIQSLLDAWVGAEHDAVDGELFIGREHLHLVRAAEGRFEIWEVRHHAAESKLAAFAALANDALKTSGAAHQKGFSFSPLEPNASANAAGVPKDWNAPDWTEAEIALAAKLSHRPTRELAAQAVREGKIRRSQIEGSIRPETFNEFSRNGLGRHEYLVLCRQDGHELCVYGDEATSPASSGLRCPVCGREFGQEQTDEVIHVSDVCAGLMSSPRWLALWVFELMTRAGVPRERIHWQQKEQILMADVGGRRLVFLLSDAAVTVESVSQFLSGFKRASSEAGVLISVEPVGAEVRRYLAESGRPAPISLLEDDGIVSGIDRLVGDASRAAVAEEIGDRLKALRIALPVVSSWMRSIEHAAEPDGRVLRMPATGKKAAAAAAKSGGAVMSALHEELANFRGFRIAENS
jgi:hypothetical protein